MGGRPLDGGVVDAGGALAVALGCAVGSAVGAEVASDVGAAVVSGVAVVSGSFSLGVLEQAATDAKSERAANGARISTRLI